MGGSKFFKGVYCAVLGLSMLHPLHGGPLIGVHARLPACIFFLSRL